MYSDSEIIEVPLESDCDDDKCACPEGKCTCRRKKDKLEKYKDENGFYQCDKCPYRTNAEDNKKQRRYFRKHLVTHLEKTVPCRECDKLFPSRTLLNSHVKTVHRKNLSCDQCDFKTNLPANLDYHKQLKHPNEPPSVQCGYCDKLFHTKRQALNHEKIRHGDKCIECKQCGKMFATKKQLGHHQKFVHEINTVNCEICDKSYKNKLSLKRHMNAVHPTELGLEHKPVTWKCPTCNSVLTSKHGRGFSEIKKRHLETHEPPKFECDYCDKSFRKKNAYDGHINEHKGLTPYKCEPCNKSYPSQGGLYQHYKRSAAHRE